MFFFIMDEQSNTLLISCRFTCIAKDILPMKINLKLADSSDSKIKGIRFWSFNEHIHVLPQNIGVIFAFYFTTESINIKYKHARSIFRLFCEWGHGQVTIHSLSSFSRLEDPKQEILFLRCQCLKTRFRGRGFTQSWDLLKTLNASEYKIF